MKQNAMRQTCGILAAAMLALASINTVMAQELELGRLFYTAKQRAALDANIRSASKKQEKPIAIPPSVTINGIVTRSDGERTVWIDGRAYHRDDTGDVRVIVRPAEPGVAEVKVEGVRKRTPVRVGQRLDPLSGRTFEPYEGQSGAGQPPPPGAAAQTGAEPASSETIERF